MIGQGKVQRICFTPLAITSVVVKEKVAISVGCFFNGTKLWDKRASTCFYPSNNIANRQDMPILDSLSHPGRFDASANGTYIKPPSRFNRNVLLEYQVTEGRLSIIIAAT